MDITAGLEESAVPIDVDHVFLARRVRRVVMPSSPSAQGA